MKKSQQGVALIFVLLMLIVISLLALNSAEVSVLQVFMAGNEQDRVSAFEQAESAEDSMLEKIVRDPDILVVNDVAGYKRCNFVDAACATPTLTLDGAYPIFDSGLIPNNVDYRVEIARAAEGYGLVPVIEGKEYSGEVFQAARFSISSSYTDPTTSARGEVVSGVSRVIFK